MWRTTSHITDNLLDRQGYLTPSTNLFVNDGTHYTRADIIGLLHGNPREWLVTKIMIEAPNGETVRRMSKAKRLQPGGH